MEQSILGKVQVLPFDKQREVLDSVKFLRQRATGKRPGRSIREMQGNSVLRIPAFPCLRVSISPCPRVPGVAGKKWGKFLFDGVVRW